MKPSRFKEGDIAFYENDPVFLYWQGAGSPVGWGIYTLSEKVPILRGVKERELRRAIMTFVGYIKAPGKER
jgi:hypothetical protein